MKPTVLFLDHKGAVGGSELCLLDIARNNLGTSRVVLLADGPFRKRLEEAGVEVTLLAAPTTVSRISREQGILRDLLAAPDVLRLAWRVARLSRDFELLYANSQKAFMIGALAGQIARKPVIWHQHALLIEHARTADNAFSRVHRRLTVFLMNHLITRVIANSKAAAAALAEAGGRTEHIRVVYNGIDPSPFETITAAEVDALRHELGLEGKPVIGAFGRLTPWKGHHVLLQALPDLPSAHVILVGEAVPEDRSYADALRERCKHLRVEDRVHFLGFRSDIPRLMRLSDVVVHTSVAPEPFGRVIVEGMLAGSVVVATRGGGVMEIVDDGVNGVLVPPGDVKALATVLDRLLTNTDRAESLAETGRTSARERFSLASMLEGVSRQLQEVAGQRT